MVTAEQIIRIRQGLSESQGQFASRFGVSQPTVCRWEKHGVPRDSLTQRAVAAVLGEIKDQS